MFKFFSSVFIFTLLSFSATEAEASEAYLQSIQQQITNLQKTISGLQETIQNQSQLIDAQGAKITILETKIEKGVSMVSPPPAPKGLGLVNWNPEIGVIGDVVTHLTESTEDEDGNDSLVVRELELAFGQYIDPHSRFDAAITLNDALEDQNVEIEQAYLTRYDLPLGFKFQLGKIRPKIGKANLLDRHALENVTEPLVISNFFAEEGWKASGVRIQNFIPNPWDIPLELTGEVLNNRGAASFSGIRRRPVFNAHLKSFFELSDTKDFELGATTLLGTDNLSGGARGNDQYNVKIYGFDATYTHHLDGIRKLKLQSELYFQDRDFRNPVSLDTNGDGIEDEFIGSIENHPWGFYALADFKFSPRLSTGVRLDYIKPLGFVDLSDGVRIDASRFGTDYSWEVSPYLTFHQREFCLFRLQYSHTENAQGISDDAIYLQARFQIGVDRHGLQ